MFISVKSHQLKGFIEHMHEHCNCGPTLILDAQMALVISLGRKRAGVKCVFGELFGVKLTNTCSGCKVKCVFKLFLVRRN